MRHSLLLLSLLAALLFAGCGDDGTTTSPSPSDAAADLGGGFDGADALDVTDGLDSTDARTGTDGTDATDGQAGTDGVDGQVGTDGTDAADGQTATGEDTVYQGTHSTLVTTVDTSENYSGKIGLKVRADGVFSGKGTGSGDVGGAPIELSASGQVTGKEITGTVVWKWIGTEQAPVTLTAEGSIVGGTLELTFKGGDPGQKFQGSLNLADVDG